jgi:putative addiction module killer protein
MKLLEVLRTNEFDKWLSKQPPKTRAIIIARLDLLSLGHFGDHKRFDGLIELRWRVGTRVYSFIWGDAIVVALNGGNKNGQEFDIKKAKKIRNEILEGSRTIQKS